MFQAEGDKLQTARNAGDDSDAAMFERLGIEAMPADTNRSALMQASCKAPATAG